ncbi:MAG: phosphate signaling complex protein PhoU [Planctomycetota bacterium]|nr:phosphate signaling complex protein PhoU [Planctomycetota bacterium]
MPIHLHRDLDRLAREILALGALVEQAAQNAIDALVHRRGELARAVIRGDDPIDLQEVEVETDCLKMLALHQPVAGDLRYIVAVLKVNNDFERMGDLAVSIAERAEFLASKEPLELGIDFKRLGSLVMQMVRHSLDALVRRNVKVAREVLRYDDAVDTMHRDVIVRIEEALQQDPSVAVRAISQLSASRNLERIADLATNIAEDVIFMVEGEVVRHQKRPPDEATKPS